MTNRLLVIYTFVLICAVESLICLCMSTEEHMQNKNKQHNSYEYSLRGSWCQNKTLMWNLQLMMSLSDCFMGKRSSSMSGPFRQTWAPSHVRDTNTRRGSCLPVTMRPSSVTTSQCLQLKIKGRLGFVLMCAVSHPLLDSNAQHQHLPHRAFQS